VDVFDALTSQRPYNKTHSTFDALSIMRNDMNKDFDPDFFARFVTLFTKH
jgi:HD-GYP domain-containing protein (c-di-GMP phosphodiesterase class II)